MSIINTSSVLDSLSGTFWSWNNDLSKINSCLIQAWYTSSSLLNLSNALSSVILSKLQYCNGLTSDAQMQLNNITWNFGTNGVNASVNSALSIIGTCPGLAGFICGLGALTLTAMGAITSHISISIQTEAWTCHWTFIVTICMQLIILQVQKHPLLISVALLQIICSTLQVYWTAVRKTGQVTIGTQEMHVWQS